VSVTLSGTRRTVAAMVQRPSTAGYNEATIGGSNSHQEAKRRARACGMSGAAEGL
jgi:hypothetical protein